MSNFLNILRENPSLNITVKMILIGILILLLLIPLQMIRSIIEERQSTHYWAEQEVIGMWGGEPVIGAPVITIPYLVHEDKNNNTTRQYMHFLPATSIINTNIFPDVLNRGIYVISVFTADISISGYFNSFDFTERDIPEKDILWEEAFLSFELQDLKSLSDKITLKWNGKDINLKQAPPTMEILACSLNSLIPINPEKAEGYSFELDMSIRGGGSLSFLPLSGDTYITIQSTWKSPSFTGTFLPTERKISEEGFEAEWSIPSYARNYPESFSHENISKMPFWDSVFGVDLIIPVDIYLKSDRAIKYGILFIIIPFIAFFLFEIIIKKKIHIFQYLLVGLANCIFYLLILSLSEHISFDPAYFLTSIITTALITYYSSTVLATWLKAMIMPGIMIPMYIFLYSVLQSEDYALLIGSIGLFVILGTVMIVTRKIDWYQLKNNLIKKSTPS
jgi:inner membrane protein